MKSLSSNNLGLLPSPIKLKKLCQAIAALEVILSPEWEYRYYSYNKDWAKEEECCTMRNGSGDEMLILFTKKGSLINGFAHESSFRDKKLITKNLPEEFHAFVFGEPVASIGTSFCIWTIEENKEWVNNKEVLQQENFYDGSKELLELLDGKPETFQQWAIDYYELENLSLDMIKQIYKHSPITKEILQELNPTLEGIKQLKEEFEEIGYEYKL